VIGWLWAALALLATAAPLQLDTVLQAVDDRVPQLAAAEAKLLQAEGKLLSARGSFDPVLSAKAGVYGGKDPRQLGDVALALPTLLGPQLEVSAGIGRGDFPPYDGDRATGPGGEWRLRGTVPLLEGLGLPEERAKLWVARAGTVAADAGLDDKRLQIRLKASQSYWKWVAAGAKLRIEQALLEQAESRNAALARQVTEGARPRIDLLDNERFLLQRRDAVALARQDLRVAALTLGLWYRGPEGAPLPPEDDALPELVAAVPTLPELGDDLQAAEGRPDLRQLDALIDAGRAERARATNALLPELSLVGEAIQPVDPDGSPELYGGAELKLPTLNRKDRGVRDTAGAALTGLEATRQGALDAARAEIEATRVAVELSWQRVEWTREAEARAAEVVQLERRRFELGGGDLFQLLGRESNLAKARKDAVQALFDYQLAQAARAAAIAAE
jgi:outer membrane protein TolC